MKIGIIKFSIRLPANQSLKGKRRVVNSICQRIRNQFNVAVAEVESNDNLKIAIIGISFVSNSTKVVQQVISQILNFLQSYGGDFILDEFNQNIISE